MGKPDDIVTTAEAATILGISPRQVRVYADRGSLPGRKLNPRTWVFVRADVERFRPEPRGAPRKAPPDPKPDPKPARKRGRPRKDASP